MRRTTIPINRQTTRHVDVLQRGVGGWTIEQVAVQLGPGPITSVPPAAVHNQAMPSPRISKRSTRPATTKGPRWSTSPTIRWAGLQDQPDEGLKSQFNSDQDVGTKLFGEFDLLPLIDVDERSLLERLDPVWEGVWPDYC